MTFSLPYLQRITLEGYRELKGEPFVSQGIIDMMNASEVGEVDSKLGETYELCLTAYYIKRAKLQDTKNLEAIANSNLLKNFPDCFKRLNEIVEEDKIPSIEFGFMDIVERGLSNRPLTNDYKNIVFENVYKKAREIASKIKLKEHIN